MKYWYIDFEEDQFWIETDEDGIALRQIISSQTGYTQVSCFEDCLAEGSFNPHEIDGNVSEITNSQFEEQWKSQIVEYKEKWSHQKLFYTIGKLVNSKVLYHYPKGYIVDLGDALGCVYDSGMNYNIGDEIHGRVKEYDDQNMWILISKA